MKPGPARAFVVDASVAAKWHLTDEENTEQARSLLPRFGHGELELWAPEQIRYEVPSAITAATIGKRPRITQEQGREAIEEFLALVSLLAFRVQLAQGSDSCVSATNIRSTKDA